MGVRIGINPIGWTNDDLPDLGNATPLETCLREAREAGFEGIELGRKFPRRAAELRPILAAHGLALVSGWYGAHLLARSATEEIAALQEHAALLTEMGCGVMIVAEVSGTVHNRRDVPLSRRPRLSDEDWRRLTGGLTEVARHLEGHGLRLAYHHHMGTVVETEADVDRLMAETGDAVGLLLDTGHLAYAGGDILGVAQRHGRRVVHCHLKDVRSTVLADVRRHDRSFLDAVLTGVFTVPGDGAVDFAALLRFLAEVGYSGWLVVEAEQDPAVADPLTYARQGFAYVRRAAQTAAL